MWAILAWIVICIAVGVLLSALYHALQPPEITPMSDEWMAHMNYQMTKPGGAMDSYGKTLL